ncbi:MAG: MHFG family PEP-CTERM protein [Inhella sp.]|jgi:hypothetical protein|nr:MHFG family PEP-CTERM protein [Inhella sp.]
MSLLATLVLAASASTATLPNCSWDRPGVNPFMGDVVAAVDRYRDIPAATRAKLKARLKDRAYDEIAVIHRDGISGQAQYGAEIRDMHFGRGSVCRSVTRSKWSAQHQERGLVYCEDGQCLIVPTVCRNVSRITRLGPKPVAGAAQDEVVTPLAQAQPEAPLLFEPPAAGGETAPTSFVQAAAPNAPALALAPTPLPGPGIGGGTPPSLPPIGGVPPLPPGLPPLPAVTPPAPEPAAWLTMGLGLAALLLRRRRAPLSV